MMDNIAELPSMGINYLGAKVSIHGLGISIWSMKDVVCNESGKTSVSEIFFKIFADLVILCLEIPIKRGN